MTAVSLPSATVVDVDALLGSGFKRTRNLVPFAIAVTSVALLTAILAPLRHHFTLLNLGMLYLLLVVLLTARFGLWTGILASVLVNLALNFFFVPPVRKLDVNESENVIALAVFLLTTALTSWLLARAERSERLAREREKESALLFDLSKSVVADPGARTVLPLLAHKARQSLGAASAPGGTPSNCASKMRVPASPPATASASSRSSTAGSRRAARMASDLDSRSRRASSKRTAAASASNRANTAARRSS